MGAAAALLAHAGPDSTWQAMVVVGGVVPAAVLLTTGTGLLHIEAPGDLLTPLAAASTTPAGRYRYRSPSNRGRGS